jgi:hypothetical protein
VLGQHDPIVRCDRALERQDVLRLDAVQHGPVPRVHAEPEAV